MKRCWFVHLKKQTKKPPGNKNTRVDKTLRATMAVVVAVTAGGGSDNGGGSSGGRW